MTGQAELSADRLASATVLVAERVATASDEMCALDALAGDGDLGTSLTAGFAAAAAQVRDLADADPATVFSAIGRALTREAPSTMGTLLGTVFLRGASSVRGATGLTAQGLADVLGAGCEAVEQRGGVTVGQRTVLDALRPSASAAREGADAGLGIDKALVTAAAAAHEGALATAHMAPQVGRAGWIPARASGHVDAGAFAWSVIISAISDAARTHEGSDDA